MRPTLALCLLALVLTACGGSAPRDSAQEFSGAQRQVATAIEDLETAARDEDPAAVCTKLLSESLLTTLKEQGTTCTTAVRDAFKDADSFDLTVDEVTVSGTKASAKVKSGSGSQEKTDTLELERVGAAWKITSLNA